VGAERGEDTPKRDREGQEGVPASVVKRLAKVGRESRRLTCIGGHRGGNYLCSVQQKKKKKRSPLKTCRYGRSRVVKEGGVQYYLQCGEAESKTNLSGTAERLGAVRKNSCGERPGDVGGWGIEFNLKRSKGNRDHSRKTV